MFIEPYLANVTIFGGNFAPRGWMFCNGQLLAISQYDALFALIGTTYGGDGQTTFALPDLRGRVAVHPGQGNGLAPIVLGQVAGTENVTMTLANIPAHSHVFASLTGNPNASTTPGITDMPQGNVPAPVNGSGSAYSTSTATGVMGAGTVATNTAPSPGNNVPIGILSPVLAMNYIICVEGIFPSRN